MTRMEWAILLMVVGGVKAAAGIAISTVTPIGMVLTVPGGLMLGAGMYLGLARR